MYQKKLRVAIVAGEASGDYLGAELIRALRIQCPHLEVYGIAGPKMQAQGCRVMHSISALSVMGLTEVMSQLFKIMRLRRAFAEELVQDPPDCFIGIDATAFNIGLEKKLKSLGIPTIHYNSPKVWAWREGRIHKIKRAVDLMMCLLPFECQVYRDHHIPVTFVGHPLADDIPFYVDTAKARTALRLSHEVKTIALLPGSRAFEIQKLAPTFLQTAKLLKQTLGSCQFVVPMINAERQKQFLAIKNTVAPELEIKTYLNQSRDVIAASDVVLIASGTATLETMLLKKPMVVAYRLSALTYKLVRKMVRVEFASLPNLLAGRELIPEYMQEKAKPEVLAAAVMDWLNQPEKCKLLYQQFAELHEKLHMHAPEQAANAVVNFLQERENCDA